MRVGIVGVNQQIKTVIANRISKINNIPPVTRNYQVQAKKMEINSLQQILSNNNLARDFCINLLLTQLCSEFYAYNNFVTDNTTIECLCYWQYSNLGDGADGQIFKLNCPLVNYDRIYYVKPANINNNRWLNGLTIGHIKKLDDEIKRTVSLFYEGKVLYLDSDMRDDILII